MTKGPTVVAVIYLVAFCSGFFVLRAIWGRHWTETQSDVLAILYLVVGLIFAKIVGILYTKRDL